MRPVILKAVITACLLLSPDARAGQPSRKEPTLVTAHLAPGVRKRMELVIFDGESFDSYIRADIEETTEVVRVNLGPLGRTGLRVRSGIQMCGATGNCTWWLFDPVTGATLLKNGLGYKFRFLAPQHNGLYDIKITQNLSCCDGVNRLYRFDGQQYRQVSVRAYSVKP